MKRGVRWRDAYNGCGRIEVSERYRDGPGAEASANKSGAMRNRGKQTPAA